MPIPLSLSNHYLSTSDASLSSNHLTFLHPVPQRFLVHCSWPFDIRNSSIAVCLSLCVWAVSASSTAGNPFLFTMAPYTYSPLKCKSEIRLLRLSPSLEDYEPLCGTLVHVDLDSHPHYKTLSYTWGEPDFACTIKLDGNTLAITQGLHAALRQLRSIGVVVVWADAICVNQKSISERNHGVSLMQRVYGNCDECLIYLGEERDNSSIIPGFLKQLYNGYAGLYNNEGVRRGDHIMNFAHDSYISIPKRIIRAGLHFDYSSLVRGSVASG